MPSRSTPIDGSSNSRNRRTFSGTMEDASGIDLDWFWRGWFYSTDHVDLGIKKVTQYFLDTENPDVDKPAKKAFREAQAPPKVEKQDRNREEGLGYRINQFPELKDFYNSYDKDAVTEMDRERFKTFLKGLEDWEKKVLETERFFYVIELENHGLVMPVPLQMTFEDGTTEDVQIPAEIWAKDARNVSRLFMTQKPLVRWRLIAL